jgi:hypothetical protein
MLRRHFVYFIFTLLFALTQHAAVTHEISHIKDSHQTSQKQDKTTHSGFCEKCMGYGDIANSITSKHLSIVILTFNFKLNSAILHLPSSRTFTVYAARAPPSLA